MKRQVINLKPGERLVCSCGAFFTAREVGQIGAELQGGRKDCEHPPSMLKIQTVALGHSRANRRSKRGLR